MLQNIKKKNTKRELPFSFCYWSIVYIQHYISFRCTKEWFNICIQSRMIASISLADMESLCVQGALFCDAQWQSKKHLRVSADSFLQIRRGLAQWAPLGTKGHLHPALPIPRRFWVWRVVRTPDTEGHIPHQPPPGLWIPRTLCFLLSKMGGRRPSCKAAGEALTDGKHLRRVLWTSCPMSNHLLSPLPTALKWLNWNHFFFFLAHVPPPSSSPLAFPVSSFLSPRLWCHWPAMAQL